jgi:molybdopterin-containing oxidoreductase family membrane subunit
MKPQGVLGIYGDLDTACSAIRSLKQSGYGNMQVLSPAPHHELEHALDDGPSGVKWFTLTGALTGLCSAIALTTWTSQDWPLVTGGKPIVISPGYFVIMFELTVLFAAIFSVTGFIVLSRLPHTRLRVGYDERFSDSSVGIWLPVSGDKASAASEALKKAGAEEVKVDAR